MFKLNLNEKSKNSLGIAIAILSYICVALMFCIAILFSTAIKAEVRKSNSDICHESGSAYFDRIKHFESFRTIKACLDSGGRLPVRMYKVVQEEEYKRAYFGAWLDEDGDCKNTRAEVLEDTAYVKEQVTFNDNCVVVGGDWFLPHSRMHRVSDPGKIDIDHTVPLRFAWEHGASEWSREIRQAFANDRENLEIMWYRSNRSKGAKGITEWLPDLDACIYMSKFIYISDKYALYIPEERKFYREQCKK